MKRLLIGLILAASVSNPQVAVAQTQSEQSIVLYNLEREAARLFVFKRELEIKQNNYEKIKTERDNVYMHAEKPTSSQNVEFALASSSAGVGVARISITNGNPGAGVPSLSSAAVLSIHLMIPSADSYKKRDDINDKFARELSRNVVIREDAVSKAIAYASYVMRLEPEMRDRIRVEINEKITKANLCNQKILSINILQVIMASDLLTKEQRIALGELIDISKANKQFEKSESEKIALLTLAIAQMIDELESNLNTMQYRQKYLGEYSGKDLLQVQEEIHMAQNVLKQAIQE